MSNCDLSFRKRLCAVSDFFCDLADKLVRFLEESPDSAEGNNLWSVWHCGVSINYRWATVVNCKTFGVACHYQQLAKWVFAFAIKTGYFSYLKAKFGGVYNACRCGLGYCFICVLSIEFRIKKNSHAVQPWFSSALSCLAVANHWSAAILDSPNTIGVMTLPSHGNNCSGIIGGGKVSEVVWKQAAQTGAVIGMIFAIWCFIWATSKLCALSVVFDLILVCWWLCSVWHAMGRSTEKYFLSLRRRLLVVDDALVVVSLVVAVIVAMGSQIRHCSSFACFYVKCLWYIYDVYGAQFIPPLWNIIIGTSSIIKDRKAKRFFALWRFYCR